jgi:hypothetical protein
MIIADARGIDFQNSTITTARGPAITAHDARIIGINPRSGRAIRP